MKKQNTFVFNWSPSPIWNLRLVKDSPLASTFSHLSYYPVPSNLNYFWGFGSLLGALLTIQILTGLFLAMYYTPDVNLAFSSVEFIMRDVKGGWLFRYMHSSGASLLFIALYCHLLRSIYYRSFRNVATWFTGLGLFFLMMATAFLGYVCVWGQMSLWGATVISSLFSTIPYIGDSIVTLLWGGFSVESPTLKRFFVLHFSLPLIIVGGSVLHIFLLHKPGSSNPLGVDSLDVVSFYPKYIIKDFFGLFVFFGLALIFLLFYYPNLLGHPDNYLRADALVTPKHITPEWYFEPFYAILRSIPDKLGGVFVMAMAIAVLAYLPLLNFNVTTSKYSTLSQLFFWFFVGNFICLGWLGMCPIEEPFIFCSRVATFFYFFYFLVVLPCFAYIESIL